MNKQALFIVLISLVTSCTHFSNPQREVIFFSVEQNASESYADFLAYLRKSESVAEEMRYRFQTKRFRSIAELSSFLKEASYQLKPADCVTGFFIRDGYGEDLRCGVMTDLDFKNFLLTRSRAHATQQEM